MVSLGGQPLMSFFQDIRYAFRILLKNPGFTFIAAFSLALGIGANAAIFSLADAILLRPLSIASPSSVVDVITSTLDDSSRGISYPNFRDLSSRSHSFDGMIAYQTSTLGISTSSKTLPQVRYGVIASGNFFETIGVQPVLGRAFLPDEDKVPGRDAVVVLAYDFWQKELAKDPHVIGRILRIKGIEFTVVGVAPESFTGVEQYFRPSFYVPAMMLQRLNADATNPLENRSDNSWSVKARLKPGVSLLTAQADVTTVWGALQREFPTINQTRTASVLTELQMRVRRSPPDSALITMLMGLVGVVLLIACANVASLLLGRSSARAREIALRISLGASRIRLLRQLLTESLLLSLFGGALGVWIAYVGISYLQTIDVPADPPIVISTKLDTRVLLFSLFAAMASAVIFGLAPALRSLKTNLVSTLKASTAGSIGGARTMGRNILVVAQVALSMVLLVASGMFLDGFHKLLAAKSAFSSDHRLMLEFDTSLVRDTPAQSHDFYRKLVDQTRAVPGVRSVSLARSIPYLPDQSNTSVVPEGYQLPKGQDSDSVISNVVDENYFGTINAAVIRGRAFTADDKDDSPRVAIVNEEFAKTYWPGQDPVGKRMRLNGPDGLWVEIVGLTETSKYLFIGEPPTKFIYLPFAQNPTAQMLLLVRTVGDPTAIATPIRDIVQGLDSNQPVFNVRTLDSFYQQRAVAVPVMIIVLVSTMGLIGLALALVGLYGLISYSVSRRTQEIGIRMAIGANRADVLAMVLRQGLRLSLIGVLTGGIATFGVARLLVSALFGMASMSVSAFVAVPLLLVAVTVAACYIPARRASTIDPISALRYE
jgi:predicted permease